MMIQSQTGGRQMTSAMMMTIIIATLLSYMIIPAFARVSPRQHAPSCRRSADDLMNSDGLSLHLQLDAWGDNSIRVRISPDAIIQTPDIQALLPASPETRTACHSSSSSSLSLTNGNMQVTLNADGSFEAVRIDDGKMLVSSDAPQFTPFIDPSVYYKMPHSLYAAEISYTHSAGDVYGLGEHKFNTVRYPLPFVHLFERSQIYDESRGGDAMIPWYIASNGFGVLFNQPGYGFVNISDASNAFWSFNATHQLDIWLTTVAKSSSTATPFAELMTRYGEATSFPEPIPHFASGYWHSKDRYRNQSEVLDIASGYSSRNVPVEVFIIDWQHWKYLGDWSFRADCWADPKSMIDTLQSSYNMRVMISSWPRIDPLSTHYEAMRNASFLTTDAKGNPLITADRSTYLYDPFKAEARQYFWQALVKGYMVNGIKLFWLDASEPEQSIPGQQYWNGRSDREIGMAWPRYHQQSVFDGSLSAGIPLNEIATLSRGVWIGSSAQNVIVWSGDVYSTWGDFNVQVRTAQNVGLSGIWWWTTDIGGYWGGDLTSDNFQQLLVRWFQFGAFCPIFRVHGHRFPEERTNECGPSGGPNELWTYKYSSQIASVIDLRQALRPYVEKHLLIASQTGVPITRPMVFDCSDTQCVTADDQFMFGPDWVVAPVLVYQANSRTVYLPSGNQWVHYYTNKTYKGGQTVTIQTTLDDFPIFQRVGAEMQIKYIPHRKEHVPVVADA